MYSHKHFEDKAAIEQSKAHNAEFYKTHMPEAKFYSIDNVNAFQAGHANYERNWRNLPLERWDEHRIKISARIHKQERNILSDFQGLNVKKREQR